MPPPPPTPRTEKEANTLQWPGQGGGGTDALLAFNGSKKKLANNWIIIKPYDVDRWKKLKEFF